MMTLEEAIEQYANTAVFCKMHESEKYAAEFKQLAAWLSILKKAKFEYDEAWRIMNCPTPDVTDNDRTRAMIILDVFRDSLGRME